MKGEGEEEAEENKGKHMHAGDGGREADGEQRRELQGRTQG